MFYTFKLYSTLYKYLSNSEEYSESKQKYKSEVFIIKSTGLLKEFFELHEIMHHFYFYWSHLK